MGEVTVVQKPDPILELGKIDNFSTGSKYCVNERGATKAGEAKKANTIFNRFPGPIGVQLTESAATVVETCPPTVKRVECDYDVNRLKPLSALTPVSTPYSILPPEIKVQARQHALRLTVLVSCEAFTRAWGVELFTFVLRNNVLEHRPHQSYACCVPKQTTDNTRFLCVRFDPCCRPRCGLCFRTINPNHVTCRCRHWHETDSTAQSW